MYGGGEVICGALGLTEVVGEGEEKALTTSRNERKYLPGPKVY